MYRNVRSTELPVKMRGARSGGAEQLGGDVASELLGHELRHEILELLQLRRVGELEADAHPRGVLFGRVLIVHRPHDLPEQLKLIGLPRNRKNEDELGARIE